jgi:hypothetical protein
VATIKIEQEDFNAPIEQINKNLEDLDTKRAYWAEIFKMRTGTRYLTPATIKAKEAKEKDKAATDAAPTLPGMGDVKTAPEPSSDVAKLANEIITPTEPVAKEAEPQAESSPSIPMKAEHQGGKHKRA